MTTAFRSSALRTAAIGPQCSRITSGEYSLRREHLMHKLRAGIIKRDQDGPILALLRGASRHYMAPDVQHPFRQCSHFRYTTGLLVPDCYYLMYSPMKGKTRNILFMNHRTASEELWEGKFPSDSELDETAKFEEILPLSSISETIAKITSKETSIFAEISDVPGIASTTCRSLHSLKNQIDELRLVKSAAEIESMRDACRLGEQMMMSTFYNIRNVDSENYIAARLQFEARKRYCDLAYMPVVAGGNRANTIHYLDANHPLKPGDCVLVDAGCDVNGYVSDITRCFPVTGGWTKPQEELYEALRIVHEELLTFANDLKRVKLSILYRRMIDLIGSTMLELGVIPKGTDNKKIMHLAEQLCPHHVSHYLGMDVHDCPSVSRDIDMPEGVVFTIEPGVYIPEDCTDFPEEFRGIGFRIEDDIVISKDGIEVLTDNIPRASHVISSHVTNMNEVSDTA